MIECPSFCVKYRMYILMKEGVTTLYFQKLGLSRGSQYQLSSDSPKVDQAEHLPARCFLQRPAFPFTSCPFLQKTAVEAVIFACDAC